LSKRATEVRLEAAMSNAAVFSQLRTFAVGLEVNARAIRQLLERDDKNNNGNDEDTGLIEGASPEDTAKEMISEVAEQDTLLRRIEETMEAQQPRQEMRERLGRLCEYNRIAFEDLEERLAEFGYTVQPKTRQEPIHRQTPPKDVLGKERSHRVTTTSPPVPAQADKDPVEDFSGREEPKGLEAKEGCTGTEPELASLVAEAEGVADACAKEKKSCPTTTVAAATSLPGVKEEEAMGGEGEEDIECVEGRKDNVVDNGDPPTPTMADWEISQ
ncbi:unnamed protein product, partial [Choristocarpus tenellus]